jgi:alpha/beta superfamily hydrolase
MTERTIGKTNAEFLAHLVEVKDRRKTMDWLRSKCPEVNPRFARDNIKFWGL